MKKPWFNQKKYGWGWGLPATWQGWVVLLLYLGYLLYEIRQVHKHFHLVSDLLLNYIPQLIFASVVLFIIVRITSGKPHWHWRDKNKNK